MNSWRLACFCRQLKPIAPLLVMPGNHDVQWWASPFGLFGQRAKYAKYRRYFGEDLTPALQVPGAVIAALLSSHGIAFGSLTWNPNDMTTIGHLPESEVNRVRKLFAEAPADAIRVAVVHHNVVRREDLGRMGLARWRTAQKRLIALGAELALSGHDHEEAATQIDGSLVVSTASTPTDRTRGHRPSVFNLIRIDDSRIQIEHHLWEPGVAQFRREPFPPSRGIVQLCLDFDSATGLPPDRPRLRRAAAWLWACRRFPASSPTGIAPSWCRGFRDGSSGSTRAMPKPRIPSSRPSSVSSRAAVRRETRRAARHEFLAFPVENHAPPVARARGREATAPGDQPLVKYFTELHARLEPGALRWRPEPDSDPDLSSHEAPAGRSAARSAKRCRGRDQPEPAPCPPGWLARGGAHPAARDDPSVAGGERPAG